MSIAPISIAMETNVCVFWDGRSCRSSVTTKKRTKCHRAGYFFWVPDLQTPKEVVQALLQFTGGRLPSSSAEEMRTRLLRSYANLVCIDIDTALTDSDVERGAALPDLAETCEVIVAYS